MTHVTCHMSRVTCHVSRVTCHVSRVTCHMSHVTCHVSLFFSFLFFSFSFFLPSPPPKKYLSYDPHRSRDSVSPVCGIFTLHFTYRGVSFNYEFLNTFWTQSPRCLPFSLISIKVTNTETLAYRRRHTGGVTQTQEVSRQSSLL